MQSDPSPDYRSKIVAAITTPLAFFALALVIAETMIGAILVATDLEPPYRMICLAAGVGLLVLIVSIVTVLAWCKPANLTFDQESHLRDRHKP